MAIGTALAVGAAIPEVYKAGLGIKQMITGNKMARHQRPAYETPQAFLDAMGVAQNMANSTRMPGQGAMESQLNAGLASSQRAVMEQGQGGAERLGTLAALHGNQQQGMQDIGIQAAQQQQQDLMNLQNMNVQKAAYQQQAWEWNKQQPYLNAMEAARREKDAGNKNMYGAIKGIAGAVNQGMSMASMNGGAGGGVAGVAQPQAPMAQPAWAKQDFSTLDADTNNWLNQQGAAPRAPAFAPQDFSTLDADTNNWLDGMDRPAPGAFSTSLFDNRFMSNLPPVAPGMPNIATGQGIGQIQNPFPPNRASFNYMGGSTWNRLNNNPLNNMGNIPGYY